MIEIRQDADLQSSNTLAIPSKARYFGSLTSAGQMTDFIAFARQNDVPLRILGGGSNLVLAASIDALVVKNALLGREIVEETEHGVLIRVFGGENWHSFVHWSVEQGFSGLENLALIPGTVGASPVQNIGAYGVEVQSAIVTVEAIDLSNGERHIFTNEECRFSYRDSIFKQMENRYLITAVTFRLRKTFSPVLGYGPLQELKRKTNLSPLDVFNQVCQIRTEKLPDPQQVPNAGSFFKNPIIGSEHLPKLLERFPNLVHFPSGSEVKLAAGWLIDQAGLKGQFGVGGVGCYAKQALVLVNPEKSASKHVLAWSEHVVDVVKEKFGVTLEAEPRYWQ